MAGEDLPQEGTFAALARQAREASDPDRNKGKKGKGKGTTSGTDGKPGICSNAAMELLNCLITGCEKTCAKEIQRYKKCVEANVRRFYPPISLSSLLTYLRTATTVVCSD
eukprot:TRINITY_DN3334_c0_g1_i2.p1 TRINITY_DN3334_c0_g1~~TRINITY_DN3334_c0_g1_i2.p1  ORF type:complete len:110 (-),score=16.61 TRINITY_DN3334_c0_g1_i2:51-380(-)